MRSQTFVFALLSLFFFAFPTFAETLKLGVSVPLTGPAATYGVDIKNILIFLNERLPKDSRFALIIEDDKCDAKEALNVAHKFVDVDKVAAVIGIPCSGTVLATAPVYERARVLAVSAGAGAPSISKAGDYIFRARPSDIASAQLLATYISKHSQRLGMLVEQTELAQGLAEAFTANAKATQIVRESFLPADTDVRPILLKLRGAKVDSLLIFSQAESRLATVLQNLHTINWHIPVYSSIFPGSPTFLKLAGNNAEGIIYSTLADRNFFSKEGSSLLQQFEESRGALNSIDYIFPVTVSAFTSLEKALRTTDPKNELYTGHFDGPFGPFTYNSDGDIAEMPYVMMRVAGGRPVLETGTVPSVPNFNK